MIVRKSNESCKTFSTNILLQFESHVMCNVGHHGKYLHIRHHKLQTDELMHSDKYESNYKNHCNICFNTQLFGEKKR